MAPARSARTPRRPRRWRAARCRRRRAMGRCSSRARRDAGGRRRKRRRTVAPRRARSRVAGRRAGRAAATSSGSIPTRGRWRATPERRRASPPRATSVRHRHRRRPGEGCRPDRRGRWPEDERGVRHAASVAEDGNEGRLVERMAVASVDREGPRALRAEGGDVGDRGAAHRHDPRGIAEHVVEAHREQVAGVAERLAFGGVSGRMSSYIRVTRSLPVSGPSAQRDGNRSRRMASRTRLWCSGLHATSPRSR